MVVHFVIPAFGRLRQADFKFEASLGYIARDCLTKQTNKKFDIYL
jgi:hypothetical protein